MFFRSFWLDEAGIALNIVSKDFIALAKPLDYNQVAPYGFLVIEKIFTILFGTEDYIFRIIPLISGILLIFIFLYLLKNIFKSYLAILTGIILINLNFDLIYYNIELKPYILDALLTSILIVAFLKLLENFEKNIFKYSVLCALALWFSYPSFFTIASIYTSFTIIFLTKKDFVRLKKLLIFSLIPTISFFIYYILILKKSGQNDYIKNFWTDHFAPITLSSSTLWWYKRAFLWALDRPLNIENLYLGTFFTLTGLFALYKERKNLFLFIILVLIFMLITSSIGRYPLYQRLLVFSVPLYYIILLYSFELMGSKIFKFIIFVFFLIFLMSPPLKNSFEIAKYNLSKQEIKPALKYISEKKEEGDLLAIHHSIDTIFEFYKEKFVLHNIETIRKIKPMWDQSEYKKALEKIKKSKRVWVLFTDFRRQENELFLGYLNIIGIRKEELYFPGTELYLYEIRSSP